MVATRQMKQQISEIIMNDTSIMKAIAQAVSLLIVKKLASHEEAIQLVNYNFHFVIRTQKNNYNFP